jgi:cholera toxin transcriptional activator
MASNPNSSANGNLRYRFGIYEADVRSAELTRDGIKVKLQEQPFQILVSLLERPGEIVTREEIIQRLWPPDTFVDFDHSLNVAIKKLREALRDDADNPRFIETKPRRGYRFIAPVQVVGAERQETAAETRPQIAEPATAPAPIAEEQAELPRAHRGLTRTMLALIQLMYLCFYTVALVRIHHIGEAMGPFDEWTWLVTALVLITAMPGIAIRLYLLMSVLFDYPKTGVKFLRIFPAILMLDTMWALSPFLAAVEIGIGLAFAVTAGLLYLPYSQRTLMRMTYSHS